METDLEIEMDDSISRFSASLGEAISQMNHNIAIMKCYMSSQNTQNKCFFDRERELYEEIEKLKSEIKSIKIHIDRGDKAKK